MAAKRVLTPQSEDFPRWYQDVVAKADLAEGGATRGTMVMKPWGNALWERIRDEVDRRIKATGHENVQFPMFIPYSFLEKEAEHVEGFSPELALVTHAGGEELAEPLVVRPTSETLFGDAMSRWVQGHRDLPLLLNQWANVVRWELRPRIFLRTTEFYWQEGHTAHATFDEAQAEALTVHRRVYLETIRDCLAIDVVSGLKTKRETFAGADLTYTHEGLMRDGKALQMATSHNLGQHFAKGFDITFTDAENTVQHAWTTSWGLSSRTVGGLIMSHGDDAGLRLPPVIAPRQVVVMAVKEDVVDVCDDLDHRLLRAGVRSHLDRRTDSSFGRRAVEWELKGVPIRLELGPRDLAEGVVTLARRDTGEKEAVPLESVVDRVVDLLVEIQADLLEESRRHRETSTTDVGSVAEIDGNGLFRMAWADLGEAGEDALAERGYSVRCLVGPDGELPGSRDDDGLTAYIAKAY
ncbi:proline--tRNA ligase [Euzebya sp.]|uniref:proline--tRNA ligase n=1 Tax=Euzebya sp. TaxID=1971409 RepID=UPI0035178AF0